MSAGEVLIQDECLNGVIIHSHLVTSSQLGDADQARNHLGAFQNRKVVIAILAAEIVTNFHLVRVVLGLEDEVVVATCPLRVMYATRQRKLWLCGQGLSFFPSKKTQIFAMILRADIECLGAALEHKPVIALGAAIKPLTVKPPSFFFGLFGCTCIEIDAGDETVREPDDPSC